MSSRGPAWNGGPGAIAPVAPPLNPTLGISTDTDNATDTTLKSMSVL